MALWPDKEKQRCLYERGLIYNTSRDFSLTTGELKSCAKSF